ncbi:MAG: hypothetical protein V2J07_10745 [Anaerolineae bacterium]|jgi:hypothetical protein|nr:hypothetical protein [Anaerolineae bacterium]
MESNTPAAQPTPVYIPPRIQVDPGILSFGAYNPNFPLIQQPTIQLTIRNVGGGTLTGRLVPQVSWMMINPLFFKLKGGESSQHSIQISTGAPQQLNQQLHRFRNCLVITSNAGPTGLDVEYSLDFNRQTYLPKQMNLTPRTAKKTARQFLPGLLVILFIVMALIGMRFLLQQNSDTQEASINREVLLTQGAETIYVGISLITDTPMPGAAILRQSTATSMSLFDPLTTDTPDLTATADQPTFTPWPTDFAVNPEVIVNSYFAALINGDYQSAWNFLTRDYQEECCTALGTDPYYIFVRDWSAVSDIKLVSAFLQEYGRNPAPVMVLYQYRNSENELQEFTQMFWLVVNEEQTGLLINQVDPLQGN